jgi:hypothetical protein
METNVMLEAIRAKRMAINEAEREALRAKEERRNDFINTIETLDERIGKLLAVANCMTENGFPLGRSCGSWLSTSSPEFISEGIDHRFGFIVSGDPYHAPLKCVAYGVGIKGGGCNGSDFIVNDEGCIIDWNERIFDRGIEEFIGRFERFEANCYKYVNEVIR